MSSGHHVYVEFSGNNPITITVATSSSFTFNRRWHFHLQQIGCDSTSKGIVVYALHSSSTHRVSLQHLRVVFSTGWTRAVGWAVSTTHRLQAALQTRSACKDQDRLRISTTAHALRLLLVSVRSHIREYVGKEFLREMRFNWITFPVIGRHFRFQFNRRRRRYRSSDIGNRRSPGSSLHNWLRDNSGGTAERRERPRRRPILRSRHRRHNIQRAAVCDLQCDEREWDAGHRKPGLVLHVLTEHVPRLSLAPAMKAEMTRN